MISSSGSSGDAPLPDGLSGSLPGSQHSTPRRSKSYNDMHNAGLGSGEQPQEDDEDLPDMNSSFTGTRAEGEAGQRGDDVGRGRGKGVCIHAGFNSAFRSQRCCRGCIQTSLTAVEKSQT